MPDLLTFTKHKLHEQYIVFYKNMELGDISLDVDGYWYFYPSLNNNNGYWSDWMLLEILTKLRQLNAKYELYIHTDPNI